jgi:hypothetical protein
MTIQEIKRVHSAQPFDPFKVHVADGRVFTVSQSEFMAQSQNGRMIYIATARGSLVALDLQLVTGVETGIKHRNGRTKSGN